jgi:hypothetical protein
MAQSTILTGARAIIKINGKAVGLFNNCSWSVRQDKQPAFILGRYSPAEVTPTTQEAVTITLSGYRVVNAGPYKVGNATMLKSLLTESDFNVEITDRQTGKRIFSAQGCRVTGWSSGVAARGVSDIRLDLVGMLAFDEFGDAAGGDGEHASSANLTDGQ